MEVICSPHCHTGVPSKAVASFFCLPKFLKSSKTISSLLAAPTKHRLYSVTKSARAASYIKMITHELCVIYKCSTSKVNVSVATWIFLNQKFHSSVQFVQGLLNHYIRDRHHWDPASERTPRNYTVSDMMEVPTHRAAAFAWLGWGVELTRKLHYIWRVTLCLYSWNKLFLLLEGPRSNVRVSKGTCFCAPPWAWRGFLAFRQQVAFANSH